MWEPSQRYPDPAVQVLDASFNKYRLPLASVDFLYTGCRWSEGPVYFGDGRYLLWSDIPNDRILKWEEETGAVAVFRKTSYNANGNTRDRQGRLVTCEHRGRRVSRTEYDGTITTLADSLQRQAAEFAQRRRGQIGRIDLVHRPALRHPGLLRGREGRAGTARPPIYRIDGQTGAVTMVADESPARTAWRSRPMNRKLYVVASAREPNRKILAYDVVADGTKLANGRMFIDAGPGGTPDGFRVDIDGNLWCGWGMGDAELDGVRIFNPAGEPIGHIASAGACANLCFGGRWRNRLFMAASHGLYSLYVNTQGAPGG